MKCFGKKGFVGGACAAVALAVLLCAGAIRYVTSSATTAPTAPTAQSATPTLSVVTAMSDDYSGTDEAELAFVSSTDSNESGATGFLKECVAKRLRITDGKSERVINTFLDKSNGCHWIQLEAWAKATGCVYCSGKPSQTEPEGHFPEWTDSHLNEAAFNPGRPGVEYNGKIIPSKHYGATMATTATGYDYVAGVRQLLMAMWGVSDVSPYIISNSAEELCVKVPRVDWNAYRELQAIFDAVGNAMTENTEPPRQTI